MPVRACSTSPPTASPPALVPIPTVSTIDSRLSREKPRTPTPRREHPRLDWPLVGVRADDVHRHVCGVHLVVHLHDPAGVVVWLDRVRAPVHAAGERCDHCAAVPDGLRVEPVVMLRREPVTAAE